MEGYEFAGIAHMSAAGPLWAATSASGAEVLISIYSSSLGEGLAERWRSWARVDSPSIARLVDVVRHEDGRWALIQGRARGRPLDLLLGSAALRPLAVRERIIEDLCEGVRALHVAGIVHGDLAPGNIIVDEDGSAVIVDLAVPVGGGEGSRGFSLSMRKDRDADWEALGRIAEALGVGVPQAAGSATPPREGGRRALRAGPGEDEDAASKLRSAAAREETLRIAPPSRRGRMIGIGALALLGCAAALSAFFSLPAPSAPDLGDGGCPGAAQALDSLQHAIEVRDQALEDVDASALAEVLSGALLDQDTARIEALKSSGARLSGLKTRIEALDEPRCEADALALRVRLRPERGSICDEEGCRPLSAGRDAVVDLVATLPEWTWAEALSVGEGGRSAGAAPEGAAPAP